MPPSDDDIWTLVESARDEALIEHRRRNPLVICVNLRFPFLALAGERLEVPALGLLSLVMGIACCVAREFSVSTTIRSRFFMLMVSRGSFDER